jgi:hypothetical protein
MLELMPLVPLALTLVLVWPKLPVLPLVKVRVQVRLMLVWGQVFRLLRSP